MTAPILGPFTKSEVITHAPPSAPGYNPDMIRMERTWLTQARPYDIPLYFDYKRRKCVSSSSSSGPYGSFSGYSPSFVVGDHGDPEVPAWLIARSYARLVEQVGKAVQGGVATAEGRQAVGMIAQRMGQMTSFTRNIFRGRFGLAAGALGLEWTSRNVRRKIFTPIPPPRLLRQPKYLARESVRSLSNIYLEFHFGWVPLMKDIHDAMEVIQHPIKPHRVKGSATTFRPDPRPGLLRTEDATHVRIETCTGQWKTTFTQRAEIIVSNPNLAKMQQWGVVNPLSIAWELVPFSFVLDWFVNVGDYLNSLTDFAGLTLRYPHKTMFSRYAGARSISMQAKNPNVSNTSMEQGLYEAQFCNRSYYIEGPTIALKESKPWGYRRGLAATSLLMQAFPKRVVSASALHLARKRTEFRQNVFPQFYGKYW